MEFKTLEIIPKDKICQKHCFKCWKGQNKRMNMICHGHNLLGKT